MRSERDLLDITDRESLLVIPLSAFSFLLSSSVEGELIRIRLVLFFCPCIIVARSYDTPIALLLISRARAQVRVMRTHVR